MGAGNQGDAANVASYMPQGGVSFTLPNSYTVTVETMPRDEITDLALLTFARMGSVTSLEDIKTQAKTILRGLGEPSATEEEQAQLTEEEQAKLTEEREKAKLEEIAQRVQSTFLNKPELASLMQYSIRNPRSGAEAWDLASQVGDPTGKPDLDKLKAPSFPPGGTKEDIKKQLAFVKQINLSNLATSLGISGFPRNAIKQTIKDKEGNIVSEVFGMGTPDNNDPVKAFQVMESSKGGNPQQKVSFTGLLTEQGSLSAYLGNYFGFKTKDESNTDSLLRNNTLPTGVTARVVSAYGRNSLMSIRFGYSNGRRALRARVSEVTALASKPPTFFRRIARMLIGDSVLEKNPKHERYFRTMQSLQKRASPLFGMEDDRTIAIALASYVEREVNKADGQDVRIVNFCKSGKDRTGAEINMINAIGMLDDQLGEGEDLDLSKQANIEKLADNYRMIQQTGVRNFISGLNSEGAGVLNGIELLPKAFKKYYEGEPEGQKFLAELEVAHAVGKQNKGWKGSEQKDLQKKYDAIGGKIEAVEEEIKVSKGLHEDDNLFNSQLGKTERLQKELDTLRKCQDIYAKGLDALNTIKANYETRDVQVAALQVIEEKEGPISKFFTDIGTAIGLGGKPISPKDKAIARLEKEMNKSKKFLYGLIPTPFSHYSDAQKASMQKIIDDVKNGTIPVNGSPADLLKNIQESKAKYDLDVVQQGALTVIEAGSKDKNEAVEKLTEEMKKTVTEKTSRYFGFGSKETTRPFYSDAQKKLMKPIIYCVDKELIKIDGNPADLLKNIQESKAKKAKYELDVVQQDALKVISTPAKLEKGDLQSEQKKGDRFAVEDSVKYLGNGPEQVVPKSSKASKELLEQLASKMENGNYSVAQKAFMQQIIADVKDGTIPVNGSPADLLKNIQESKAKYDLDVVQQDALTVIKEVLSEQEPEAEILSVQEIDRDSYSESVPLLDNQKAPTPEQAVIKGLEKIQSHYSSEQKALMQNVIGALNERTMTLDGNPSDEDYEDYLLNQISGAIDGSGRATVVTNPLSVDVRHMIQSPPPKSHENDQSVETVWGSLSSARKVMAHQVASSKGRDQELGGRVETGKSLKKVSDSHKVGKENKVPNEKSEEMHTHTRFGSL